jgi:hypothetical protein
LLNIRAGLLGSDFDEQMRCVVSLRTMLSIERNPPIQQVIDAGFVPHLVRLLHHNHDQIKVKAFHFTVWVLSISRLLTSIYFVMLRSLSLSLSLKMKGYLLYLYV